MGWGGWHRLHLSRRVSRIARSVSLTWFEMSWLTATAVPVP
jgi:hypothetical protein